jgi:pSer/pThr/pTyr-binding forkhead associated (FHA) protein
VPAPQPITTSATAAAALIIGTFINRPNPSTAATTTTATTNHGCSHLIRFVPQLDTRSSFRFDAISLDLKEGDPSLRIGRFTRSDKALAAVNALDFNKLGFRSVVVSRVHAEIWVESGGRVFVKDTKSSSGTFLNDVRLSITKTESTPFQIKDGDILQLGVDCLVKGAEVIYKSVRIKIELGSNAFKYVTFDSLLFFSVTEYGYSTKALLKKLKTLALGIRRFTRVDYQGGGAEDIYKSVKIKIELGKEWQASDNAFKYVTFDFSLFFSVTEYGYSMNALLKNLKTLALGMVRRSTKF